MEYPVFCGAWRSSFLLASICHYQYQYMQMEYPILWRMALKFPVNSSPLSALCYVC